MQPSTNQTQNTSEANKIAAALQNYTGEPGQLIPLLQAVQEACGFIPQTAIKAIADLLGVSQSRVYGVITFYKQFRLRPVGKYLIRVCDGTACHVNEAKTLINIINDELELTSTDTTTDGLFTISPVACLGCCSLAPVIMINDQTFGRLTPQKLRKILKRYQREGAPT